MKPHTLESDQVTCFDVDNTLVIWDDPSNPKAIEFDCYGDKELLVPHEEHIKFLKRQKTRGLQIVVWSAGGWAWAKHVVETLQLEEHVDLVMCKPLSYVDDIKVEEWLQQRIYFKPGQNIQGEDE